MLCCSEQVSGVARFPKDLVIERCEGTLRSIKVTKTKLKRDFIESELGSQIWWWEHLWRWVSLGLVSKPTIRTAIREWTNPSEIPG